MSETTRQQIIRDPSQLLLHRAPMLLLDEILDYDNEHARARVTISSDSPFCDAPRGGVPAWVGIEYMAQTIGAWSGAHQLAQGKPIQIGLLLGTRRYASSCELFAVGCELTVEIRVLYSEKDGLGSFNCRIDGCIPNGVALTATARINAFQPEQPQPFLKSAEVILATGFPQTEPNELNSYPRDANK